MTDFRQTYGLPARYFLSLGRMVEKKNLATLLAAYGRYVRGASAASQTSGLRPQTSLPALVLVGSGELEAELEAQARALGLHVVDRREAGASRKAERNDGAAESANRSEEEGAGGKRDAGKTENRKLTADDSIAKGRGTVFFYGFRQIEENPVFYALAEAFILPSLYEEWGLVVNEAMACSLPVIVSRTAGCAEDLLPAGPAGRSGQCSVDSVQPEHSEATDDRKLQTTNLLEQRPNGFVFEPTSVEALTEALRRMAESEALRAEMGARSREIVERFSCGSFAREALRAAEAAGTT